MFARRHCPSLLLSMRQLWLYYRPMKKVRLLACAIASALLFALGLPNEAFLYGFPALGYVCLVPLYFAMLEVPSYGFAALMAGIYGATHHGVSSYWLFFFHDFAFWTLGSTIIAYAVVYAVYGLYLAFFLKKAGPYRPLAFALFWTVLEFAKSVGFLGYPWGLLPYTQSEVLPLLQIADMTGIYGISFVLAFANAAVAELFFRFSPGRIRRHSLPFLLQPSPPLRRETYRTALAAVLVLAIVAGYGCLRLAFPAKETGSFTAALVQQNMDPWSSNESDGIKKNMDLARGAVASFGGKPDIILFSESSLSRPYREMRAWYERNPRQDPFIPFMKEMDSYLFTGSPIVLNWEKGEATNSVILLSPSGEQLDDYAKVHPVPFAEAIPFWEWKPFRDFMQNVVGLQSGWVMGKTYTIFRLPVGSETYRFGAPICFEDAFPDVCRNFVLAGADLLVNLTNDSWSKTESSETQHFAAARFRAIEFRKALVRSTNGGVTCVIGAEGKVRDQLPLFRAAAKVVQVPIYRDSEATVYLRFGDWFAYGCILLFASAFFILWWKDAAKRRRSR